MISEVDSPVALDSFCHYGKSTSIDGGTPSHQTMHASIIARVMYRKFISVLSKSIPGWKAEFQV